MELCGCSVGVRPPFGAPDPSDPPTEVGQDHLSQSVPVAGRGRAMVGCSIAFHPSEIVSGRVWIDDPEIDPEARDTHLRVHDPAAVFQRALNSILKGRVRALSCGSEGFGQRSGTAIGKLQEVLKIAYAARVGPG